MSFLRVVKRREPLGWGSFVVLAAAICLSLLLSGIILFIGGTSPLEGIVVLFKGAFGNRYALDFILFRQARQFYDRLSGVDRSGPGTTIVMVERRGTGNAVVGALAGCI